MLESEEFFYEFIEDIEIKATCADCGKATLGMLLHDYCRDCMSCAEGGISVSDFLARLPPVPEASEEN